MAAYLIAHATVINAANLPEYATAAAATFAPFGGAPLARGKVVEVLAGSHTAQSALIVKFPDAKSAHAWFHSPAYQALIPLRNTALEVTFVVIEEA
ncbi:MAG: DUF1330 domain-containing protein [Gammaproteobacteria bacterium]|nr:DUF1330 domain-containing protein [Gammaproteobacteria bacterium]